MREKLNENPVAQMLVIGVLVIVVGFLFMTRMKSASDSGSSAPPTASTLPAAGDSATATADATDPVVSASATDPAAAAAGSIAPAAPPVAGAISAFKAGPGLPKSVVKAYDSGDAVALLVSKSRGIDDKEMRKAVASIRGKGDVDLFTVRVHHVAKYSQITQGVDLDRAPALIVIRPKRLTKKEQPPSASVSYGYRDPQSVAQAVEDQLYHGKTLGYSPK